MPPPEGATNRNPGIGSGLSSLPAVPAGPPKLLPDRKMKAGQEARNLLLAMRDTTSSDASLTATLQLDDYRDKAALTEVTEEVLYAKAVVRMFDSLLGAQNSSKP